MKSRRGSGSSCPGDLGGGRAFRGRSLFPALGVSPPLSTWRENARFLSSQPAAMRFAFLCAYARHASLRHLGLQLVGALRYPLVPFAAAPQRRVPRPLHVNTFTGLELISLRLLTRCLLQSEDRCDVLAGKLGSSCEARPHPANQIAGGRLLATAVWVGARDDQLCGLLVALTTSLAPPPFK